jgi:hypothetical protein
VAVRPVRAAPPVLLNAQRPAAAARTCSAATRSAHMPASGFWLWVLNSPIYASDGSGGRYVHVSTARPPPPTHGASTRLVHVARLGARWSVRASHRWLPPSPLPMPMALVTQRAKVGWVVAATIDALSYVVHCHRWSDSARPTQRLSGKHRLANPTPGATPALSAQAATGVGRCRTSGATAAASGDEAPAA